MWPGAEEEDVDDDEDDDDDDGDDDYDDDGVGGGAGSEHGGGGGGGYNLGEVAADSTSLVPGRLLVSVFISVELDFGSLKSVY